MLNAEQRVERFVRPLWDTVRAAGFPTELVVVDDGSADATTQAASGLAAEVRVVCHEVNRGLPAARNTAVLAARHEWLLFCDDDLTVDARALARLWDGRRVDACTVPEVRGVAGELQNSVTAAWRLLDRKFDFATTPLAEVAYPMGACFFINRATLVRAGGFDERFRLYYEDTNFGAALQRAGVPVVMLEGTTVVHHSHGSGMLSDERRAQLARQVYEARWRYGLSVRGWRHVVMVLAGLPRACRESIAKRTPDPLLGYLRAVGDAPEMLRSRGRYDLRSRSPIDGRDATGDDGV